MRGKANLSGNIAFVNTNGVGNSVVNGEHSMNDFTTIFQNVVHHRRKAVSNRVIHINFLF